MSHLSSETVAAYLDHSLSPGERAAADAHLADCARCRGELVEVRGILQGERRRRRTSLVATGGLAAAAVAAMVILVPFGGDRPGATPGEPPGGSPLRDGGAEVEGPVPIETLPEVLDPDGGQGSVLLRWHPVSGAATYRVTLADAEGAPVWAGEVADTSVLVPSDIRLEADAEYFWFVDATLAGGRASTSGIRTFRAR